MRRDVEFWMGGYRRVVHSVHVEDIERCYMLGKTADRFAFWREVTGDNSIVGPVLIWAPAEPLTATEMGFPDKIEQGKS